MPDYNSSVTILTLLLAILIFWRSIILRKKTAEQSLLIASQTDSLNRIKEKLNRDEEVKMREVDFQASLKQAEITTELQKSRSTLEHGRSIRRPPERYQYAQSMYQSGIHTSEISSALGMSKTEITQLLKLAEITCKAKDKA
ncbi:MAG TPA: hypothetical protein EYP35_06500 [Desulfobacterales bacterium]|nr:hypothetical protein [Desulfobacterales bacterium]HIP39814.1 hypothetical protein [Desulfocapsa sulfexigens]